MSHRNSLILLRFSGAPRLDSNPPKNSNTMVTPRGGILDRLGAILRRLERALEKALRNRGVRESGKAFPIQRKSLSLNRSPMESRSPYTEKLFSPTISEAGTIFAIAIFMPTGSKNLKFILESAIDKLRLM